MDTITWILTTIAGCGLFAFIISIFKGKKEGDDYEEIKNDIGIGESYDPDDSVQHDIDESVESAVSDALEEAKSATESNINKLKSRPRDSRGRFISTK